MDEADRESKSGRGPPSKKILLALTIAGAIIGLLFAMPGALLWLGPRSELISLVISFAVIGALAGALLAGLIVLVWLVANKYGAIPAFIIVALTVSVVVVFIIGLNGGFDPTHRVTVAVDGQGKADVVLYNPYEVESQTVTLPWTKSISTKDYVGITAYGKTGVQDLHCSVEVDGQHIVTWHVPAGAKEEAVRCSYTPQ